MTAKKEESTDILVKLVTEGIFKKKGREVVVLDLSKIENAITKRFVIVHGDSDTQVSAIAHSVIDVVREVSGERPLNKDGMQLANWILLDYSDVIVHIFQEPVRRMYQLEDLWADAVINKLKDPEGEDGDSAGEIGDPAWMS